MNFFWALFMPTTFAVNVVFYAINTDNWLNLAAAAFMLYGTLYQHQQQDL